MIKKLWNKRQTNKQTKSKENKQTRNMVINQEESSDWSTPIGLAASLVNVLLFSPLFYSIIWYEKSGSGSGTKRTLINQLVSSGCWVAIVFNVSVQIPEIILSLNGPFNECFCRFHLFIKYVLALYYILILLAISIIKYLYIFVLKSPTDLNDAFWIFFINLITVTHASIWQFVYQFLPGRNAYFYYLCVGELPSNSETVKFNYFLSFSLILTISIYIIVLIKMKLYEMKDPIPTVSLEVSGGGNHLPSLISQIIKNSQLANLSTIALGLSLLLPCLALLNVLNYADPKKLDIPPYKYLVNVYQHFQPAILHAFILLSYFKGQRDMRKTIGNEFRRLIKLT